MQFKERELKHYAEPVPAGSFKQGEIYFSVQYADDTLLVPIMETWVYAGRKLRSDDIDNCLYFQDVGSYLQGIRYETSTKKNSVFQLAREGHTNHIFEFSKAVEELLRCELRRSKAQS